MSKLAVLVLVIVVAVLAEVEIERQKQWNHTAEISEKKANWYDNGTHVILNKPLPTGFIEAYWYTTPSPCLHNLTCGECVRLKFCGFYVTLGGAASFCGKQGNLLGCDYNTKFKKITSIRSCQSAGFGESTGQAVAVYKQAYKQCRPTKSCLDCVQTSGCQYYVTGDNQYSYCGRKVDEATAPLELMVFNETEQCQVGGLALLTFQPSTTTYEEMYYAALGFSVFYSAVLSLVVMCIVCHLARKPDEAIEEAAAADGGDAIASTLLDAIITTEPESLSSEDQLDR